MKPKSISLFLLLGTLESLALFILEITSPSSVANYASIAGLSGPRLIIAAFLLLSTLAFGGIWLFMFFRPGWRHTTSRIADAYFSRPDNLLAASFFTLLTALSIPVLSALGLWLRYGQIIKRMAHLLFWVEGLAILLLGMLVICYPSAYRQQSFFANALLRIGRASFIGRTDF